jgi:ABC-type antimicrobial peptide transport system permease subunit
MILKRGVVLVGIGLTLGIAGAYSGTLLIQQLLFETQPLDPATYVSAVGVLAFATMLACFLPAWRATRLSLVDVLRRE